MALISLMSRDNPFTEKDSILTGAITKSAQATAFVDTKLVLGGQSKITTSKSVTLSPDILPAAD